MAAPKRRKKSTERDQVKKDNPVVIIAALIAIVFLVWIDSNDGPTISIDPLIYYSVASVFGGSLIGAIIEARRK